MKTTKTWKPAPTKSLENFKKRMKAQKEREAAKLKRLEEYVAKRDEEMRKEWKAQAIAHFGDKADFGPEA